MLTEGLPFFDNAYNLPSIDSRNITETALYYLECSIHNTYASQIKN